MPIPGTTNGKNFERGGHDPTLHPTQEILVTTEKSTTANEDAGGAQEYLTFTIGREEYAIDILKVQEIRGYENPTTIANAPDFLKGVVNLRGIIVPIVDMRIKFRIGQAEYTPSTVVIILSIRDRLVGIVVDSVSEVTMLRADQIHPAPEFGSSVDSRYITGMGTLDDRMLVVIDIEKLMFNGDMALVDAAADAELVA